MTAAVDSATVADRRLHPGTIGIRFLKEVPSTVLAAPAALAFASDVGLAVAFAFAAVLAVVMLILNWIAWTHFHYGVGARDIVIEKGIFSHTRRSIPFDRIQDVDIERRLLARLFGLAKVRIETGGGGKDEGVLDSVSVDEADRLRAAVRAARAAKAAPHAPGIVVPAGDEAPAPASLLLFAMDLKRVFLHGLFNFSLVYIAGLFALLQTFEPLLPFDIYDPARWVGLVGTNLPERFTVGAILAILAFALLLGVIAGLVTTLAREYGFRLLDEGRRLRRERGLLTHTEVVLGKKRLQLALVRTGPIRSAFGWFALFFQSLGAGSDGSGRQSAAPFARLEELDPVLASAGSFRRPEVTLAPVSRRHIARSALRLAVPALVILAASFWQPQSLWLLLLLPLFAAASALQRHYHRYALAGDLLFVQRGFWRRHLWIVPAASAQAISISRTRPQRWLDLATLSVDTAGAPMGGGVRIVDLRHAVAKELAAEVASSLAQASGRKSGTDR